MNLYLLTQHQDSPVARALNSLADNRHWQLTMLHPSGLDLTQLPGGRLQLIVIDASNRQAFHDFINWYEALRLPQPQFRRFVVLATQYDHQEAIATAGYYDILYALLPDSEDTLATYLLQASGNNDNFIELFRSQKSSSFSEIIDRYTILSVADRDGRIVYANDNLCQISGYSRQELIGTYLGQLNAAPNTEHYREEILHTLRTGTPWKGYIHNISKNGRDYWVNTTVYPICDSDGIIQCYLTIRYDVTDEVRLKEELLKQDERFRISHQYAKIGTWDLNIATGQLYLSDNIHKLFGIETPVNETFYKSFLAAIHPDDRELVARSVDEATQPGKNLAVEHRVIYPDGTVRWLAERGHVQHNAEGKAVRMLGVVSDIHELIVAKQNAIAAEQMKSAFISTLSHEIRNPLNAILGFSEIIATADSLKNTAAYAEKISSIVTHVTGLLEDVNLASRLESGNITREISPVDVGSIITESIDIIAPTAGGLPIHKESISGWVHADKQHLRQIIINLLSNAIKYNRKDGSINVRSFEHNGFIRIEVEDTGWGIPQDKIDHLFTPYQRLDWAGSEIEGLGLGLSICKDLVELMAGHIGVTSEPNSGSTFWLELPAATSSNHIAPPVKPLEPLRREMPPLHILILEDNLFNQEFLAVLLKKLGVSADIAGNGLEGLRKLEETRYDVVLTDINMPVMNGREFIQKVRQHKAAAIRQLPIVIISAGENNKIPWREIGATAFLSKPFTQHKLMETLLDCLDGSTQAPPRQRS